MENGSDYFFSLLVGWRGKEMEQSTEHNPAFRAVARKQKLHKCKISFRVCSMSETGDLCMQVHELDKKRVTLSRLCS